MLPPRSSWPIILMESLLYVRQKEVTGQVAIMFWWCSPDLIGKMVFSILYFSFNIYSAFVAAFHVYFDFLELNQKTNIQYELVDMKTITFQTPACLFAPSDQNRTVLIVIIQNEKVIGKFNFVYLSRKCTTLHLTKLTILVQQAPRWQRMCARPLN